MLDHVVFFFFLFPNLFPVSRFVGKKLLFYQFVHAFLGNIKIRERNLKNEPRLNENAKTKSKIKKKTGECISNSYVFFNHLTT